MTSQSSGNMQHDAGNVKTVCWAVYWMYAGAILAGILGLQIISMVLGLAAFITAIVYRNKDDSGIYRSHFMNQIVVSLVGIALGVLMFVVVGGLLAGGSIGGSLGSLGLFLVLALAVGIWALIRLVRGMLLLNSAQPYPNDGKGFI